MLALGMLDPSLSRPLLALDLMDTVVVDPFRRVMREASAGGPELESVMNPEAWVDFELGLVDETTYLRRMIRSDTGQISSEAIRDAILHNYRFVLGMEELLGELRGAGVRLWGLSNYPPWARTIQRELRLDRFFEGYTISYQTGARKPDAAAFEALCAQAGVPSGGCLLVDDEQANVEGARQVGMPAILFQGADHLRGELKRLGLL